MLYIILVAVILFLIYREKFKNNKVENSKSDKEFWENYVLSKINETGDKEIPEAFYYNTKNNFQRLNERFKFDEIKKEQILNDWIQYCKNLGGLIYLNNTPSIVLNNEDIKKHNVEKDDLIMIMEEIQNRYKKLLGTDYIDPNKKHK